MLAALRLLWITSLAAFAVLFVFAWTRGNDAAREEDYARDVRRAQSADAHLNELVLRSRYGLINHWDPVANKVKELAELHRRLAVLPAFLSPEGKAELAARVSASKAVFTAKADQIETFKTDTSILRNSVLYFPGAASELANRFADAPKGQGVASRIKELLGEVLIYNMMAEVDARDRVEFARKALREALQDWPSPFDKSAAENLDRHVEIIVTNKPLVDAAAELILAQPARASDIEVTYSRYHRLAIDDGASRRVALFLLALGTLVFLASEVFLRQQRASLATREVRDALQTANVALRREREREKELGDLKSRFVSMTSHEFRTPLSVIRSSAELLEAYWSRWTEKKRGEHLRRIHSSAAVMAKLLDGVLTIGRAEASELDFNPKPIDLNDFCADLVETMQQSFPGTPIAYSMRGETIGAHADEQLLRHILTNLISNAIKYSPPRSRVDFEVEIEGTNAKLLVRDRGIGIPEGDRRELFGSFHRGSNVGDIPGTGLGLAVVKRSVDRHGGVIEVESEEGTGTTFVVTIPIEGET